MFSRQDAKYAKYAKKSITFFVTPIDDVDNPALRERLAKIGQGPEPLVGKAQIGEELFPNFVFHHSSHPLGVLASCRLGESKKTLPEKPPWNVLNRSLSYPTYQSLGIAVGETPARKFRGGPQ